MARIRTIKPQFWTDESVVSLPYEFRLLFIGLWNFADDDGFLENRPRQIKLQVFPGDDVDVVAGVRALVKLGLVESLRLGGDPVLRIKGWRDHQVISRPTPSKYRDDYAEYQAERATHGALHAMHGVSRSTPSGREGKGRERKGKESAQVGGGGYVSSADTEQPPPPISAYEPWRCDTHQGVDTPCHACKRAKADHKASEAQRAREAKDEARAAARAESAQRRAEAEADRERIDPDAGKRAIETFQKAMKGSAA